jgi:hypothetical protein
MSKTSPDTTMTPGLFAEQPASFVDRPARRPRLRSSCPRGGEVVDYTIGLCSCGECPTPCDGWQGRVAGAEKAP